MTPIIRRVSASELQAFVTNRAIGFLEAPPAPFVEEAARLQFDLLRTWAAFEGDVMIGTFRSWGTELTVPGGGLLPGAAITNVTVKPSHQRRGIMRELVAAEHAAIRERGEAVALLYAAQYSIYGRFGYGPATRIATWTIDRREAEVLGAPSGRLDLVDPEPATRSAMIEVFEAARRRQPGEIRRNDTGWDVELGISVPIYGTPWTGWVALHRDGQGAVTGYARYRTEPSWRDGEARGRLIVDDLQAADEEAYAALWRYLCQLDLVGTVTAAHRNPTERLWWLLVNPRAAVVSEVVDGLWVRLMDVPRALEARTYERDASLVLDVIDAEAPGGRIRVALDATTSGARARPTTRSADLTLDVSALGAVYLGGTWLRDAARPTGVDEHTSGAVDRAETLFRTLREPWCSSNF